MTDLLEELFAVERTVADGEVPAGPAKVIRLCRTLAASPEEVWDALSDPERLSRWFLPVTGELTLGGSYQFEGNAGGEIRVCEPPRRIVATWVMGPVPPQDVSLVEVTLSEDDGATQFVLEHRAQVPPEMWDQFGPGAVGVGWDGGLLGLVLHLAGLHEDRTAEELAFDPAWREFSTESATAWATAHIAAGEDEATAQAMAAATTSFYVPPLEETEP